MLVFDKKLDFYKYCDIINLLTIKEVRICGIHKNPRSFARQTKPKMQHILCYFCKTGFKNLRNIIETTEKMLKKLIFLCGSVVAPHTGSVD